MVKCSKKKLKQNFRDSEGPFKLRREKKKEIALLKM